MTIDFHAHPVPDAFRKWLPLPYVDGSIAEIRRCMAKGALGVKVPTNANGVYLGDPALDPVMEELDRQRWIY